MNKEFITQEVESLIRSLEFIQEEQAFIKRKLSSLLENLVMNDFIVWAEELQLQILNREAAVKLLLIDILVLKKGIKASKSANNLVESKLVAEYKKYKLQVVYLENEFIDSLRFSSRFFDRYPLLKLKEFRHFYLWIHYGYIRTRKRRRRICLFKMSL